MDEQGNPFILDANGEKRVVKIDSKG